MTSVYGNLTEIPVDYRLLSMTFGVDNLTNKNQSLIDIFNFFPFIQLRHETSKKIVKI